jgi:hypothetical protein
MSEDEQIEQRIENLPLQEFAKLRAWFVEFYARAWDHQIEADAKAGKLDGLISEALANYKAGKAREL